MEAPFDVEKWRKEQPMDYFKAMELLLAAENTVIRDVTFDQIYKVTRLHIPDKLFKYCSLNNDLSLNELKFQTLKECQVYHALSKDMNDPFDGRGYFYHHEELLKFERIRNAADPRPFDFAASARSASFTANGISSMPMWAHYGSNHAGYALEYDMTAPSNRKLAGMMFPVQYTNKRLDVTPVVVEHMNRLIVEVEHNLRIGKKLTVTDDRVLIFMCCLFVFLKHESWSYEKEFRSSINAIYDKLPAVPSAIYIGLKCSEENSKKLLEIGKSIGAKVYKMTFDEHSSEYNLIPKLLQ